MRAREHGAVVADGVQVASTHQCGHCNRHFVLVAGEAGFCRNCMQTTCGQKCCDDCMPFEKKLDLYEKGKLLSL